MEFALKAEPEPLNCDEAYLLRFVTEGDRGALGELAARHESALLALAGSILTGYGLEAGMAWGEAREVVQDAWVQVIRKGDTFKGKSSFKTWLYRVVINLCKNRATALNRRQVGMARLMEVKRQLEEETADGVPTVWLERMETQRWLLEALQQLGVGQREILLLCYHGGMSHGEAAEVLEIPVGTLKSRLNAGLNELRELLGVGMRKDAEVMP